MKKNNARSKILIELQKRGYRSYIIPEDTDKYKLIEKIKPDLLMLGEAVENSFLGYIDDIKKEKSISDIPIIAIVDKHIEGAMDIVYIKEDNPQPVVEIVDKFLGEDGAKFDLKVLQIGDRIVFRVLGELDMAGSVYLREKFNDYFREGNKKFIIDIGEVDYLESVGLGVLIHIQKSIVAAKGEIKYIITSEKIKKLLVMVKLDKYFEIYSSLEELVVLPEGEKKIKAVVIDDARFMRKLITGLLNEEGFETIEFENPVKALAEIDSIRPDIILVDYEMPEMNGIEFIQEFKPALKDIPTIMLTTVKDINLALKAIRMGASDFLNKPFEKEELIHIIKKIVRANSLKRDNERLLLELKKREKELEKKSNEIYNLYTNLEEELQMASEIQRKLMPETFPELDNWRFAVKYLPSQDIGGDFYDVLKMSNGYYGVAFADISGHGIPAALLSTMFKVYLITYSKDIIFPAETMELLNEVAVETFPDGKFISVFYLIMREDSNKVIYCKAAQEPGLLIKKDGTIEEMSTKGQVLGLFSAKLFPGMIEFEQKEVEVESGEKIFLYTDGIVEARNKKDEFYGMERLEKILKQNSHRDAEELIEVVYGDLLDYLEGMPVSDDLTLMVIEKK